MAIENTTVKTDVYQGNGSTTEFAFSFRIDSQEDLKVYVKKGLGAFELQELNQDYELELTYDSVGNISGGTIIYPKTDESLPDYEPEPLGEDDYIYAIRETPKTQEETSEQVSFQSKDIERGLDKATMQIQELTEEVGRCVKIESWQDIDPDEIIEAVYDAVGDAGDYATAASNSANQASGYANNASTSATNSHKWAEGSDADVSSLGGTHSSKVWAEQAEATVSSMSNKDLSNLTETGEEHFDNRFAFKNLSNVPSNILNDRIVASGFDGFGSYFFQYASGAIRQGGIIPLSSGWQTITLFREMPNTNYIITTGAIISDGDNPSVFIRSTNKTTTSFEAAFKWDTSQYKTGTLMWEAFTMGYTQGEE